MKLSRLGGVALTLAISTAIVFASYETAKSGEDKPPGLANAVVLIIRHAEKPEVGVGLSAAGEKRARAYTNYFSDFSLGSTPLKLDYLFAAADSKESLRPRLTLEPLGKALDLKIDCRFKNKQFLDLVHAIQGQPPGKSILICWHHGEIPHLLQALGADPEKLLPKGGWPDKEFDWLIELRYDAAGKLIEDKRINEGLVSDTAN